MVGLRQRAGIIQALLILGILGGHVRSCSLRLRRHQLLQRLQLLDLTNVDLGKRLQGVEIAVGGLTAVVQIGQGRLSADCRVSVLVWCQEVNILARLPAVGLLNVRAKFWSICARL